MLHKVILAKFLVFFHNQEKNLSINVTQNAWVIKAERVEFNELWAMKSFFFESILISCTYVMLMMSQIELVIFTMNRKFVMKLV